MCPSPAGEVNNALLPMRAILPPALTKPDRHASTGRVDLKRVIDVGDCRDRHVHELSRVIRNGPAASVTRTIPIEPARALVSVSSERSLSDIPLFQPKKAARVPDETAERLRHPRGGETLRVEIVSSPSSPNGSGL